MAKDLDRRARKFCIELYPDNETHVNAIDVIINNKLEYNLRWVAILHDKDTYEDDTADHKAGDLKKKHYHFCIALKDPKTRQNLAWKLGIDSDRFIEPCKKWTASLMYLIHFNVDKFQYDLCELLGDSEYIQYITETSQRDNKYLQFNNINNYIMQCDGIITFTELMRVCVMNGWVTALQKNQNLFINAVNQHNKYIAKR